VPPSNRAATWGEHFSCAARGRGAVGVVSDGDVRDARQIEELDFPAFARGCSPLDTLARAVVADFGSSAVCGGVRVARGDLIVADRDGVVVIPEAAAADVADGVRAKRPLEDGARRDLLAGTPIREVWERYGVF
jgi:4-hydroxy-4-methyl-2-oxoglutarate aldolase